MNIRSYDAIVVGTGAAGYNAAVRIKQFGQKSVAIVTEAVKCGTSRNTGSDKQTYYKLGLGGDTPDSVMQMAENLFSCGAVDGDTALCEAALSARSFLHLCELGVAFPKNRYGEYVGYKTDHDPFARATSAGPLTSKYMTQALEKKARELDIEVFDRLLAVEILKDKDGVCGLLCLKMGTGEFVCFSCPHVVLATGGPAGIYADSVYPEGHTGSTGLAVDAGAALQNMTEWQYGLASVRPRWNVSGTYMQVLPRFVSVGEDGEREFLLDFFTDPYEALSAVFLKGYQWPFDSKKVLDGSSVIDLLVYRERVMKNRRVYLDFTKNPFGLSKIDFEKLASEAFAYLTSAKADFGIPIERLLQMNPPAVELYQSKGLDISSQYLEIALCAQHNNGGIAVDLWWQTNICGLFAVGECAGTHGVTRPGGSALNAGQVGSLRAAEYISQSKRTVNAGALQKAAEQARKRHTDFCDRALKNPNNAKDIYTHAARRMSESGAAIRELAAMQRLAEEVLEKLKRFESDVGVSDVKTLFQAYKLKDMLTVQAAVLTALIDFSQTIGKTRGSSLICDDTGKLRDGLEELFRFQPDGDTVYGRIQQVMKNGDCFQTAWRDVRPIPDDDHFFENVWRGYRENQNVY
ncbi:MAG: FAD-binding protein [Clostridiales bacterium]|nr:FAD-binding protein [Clostridiales bacterium]